MMVIGNGESRLSLDIDRIAETKIGCNAIVRDHTVEHLVCVDKRILKECVQYSVNACTVYTRSKHVIGDSKFVQSVPKLPYTGKQRWDDPIHWGSGPYAVLLAAGFSDKIKMIGFDLYSRDNSVNNCYKDTENYDHSSKRAVDPRYWIHQIGKIFKCFPKTAFTIYQTPDWQLPEKWNYTNVQVDKISNFTYN
jgi:hypothetical protein